MKKATAKTSNKDASSTVAPATPVSAEMKSLLDQVGGKVTPPAPSHTKSAKQYIREALAVDGVELTVEDMCKASGCTPVNIRTMLSDLRSPKYAGKAGVFITKSVRKDGKTFYSKQ